jgi:hypothetical protein
MPWKPEFPGEFPTLGWGVLEFFGEQLAAPDRADYEPFTPTREQAEFILKFYRLDSVTGRRLYRRARWSRPKGHGKSPLMSAVGIAEALGDVVPDGWDADGRPVGKPWATVRTPWIQFAAVSEDQTKNSWIPLLEMLRNGPVVDNFDVEPLDTFVNLPRGRIEPVTSSSTSREGNRPVFVVMDQTEEWKPNNGGTRLAATLRRNLGKTDGASIESPNAFIPGEDSVAEQTAVYADAIREGKVKDPSLLDDHREAPADTNMADRESLIVGLEFAYGDSAERAGGWVNLDRLVAEIWDPSTDPQDARRYYLNQITHAADSWLSAPELRAISVKEAAWLEVHGEHRPVSKHDAIVLGFDGSRGRAKSKPDATALVAMRVSDGFSWQVGVWEPPDGPTEQDWVLSELEVEAAVDEMFNDFTVVGFYGDPAMWEDRVAKWEAKYFRRLKVKCTAEKPIAFNTRAISKVVYGFEALHGAIVNGEISYDGSRGLTRHALNARRQKVRSGIVLRKPNDDYLAKIDATYAWMLANLCRLDALGKGVGAHVGTVPRRIY